MKCTSQLYLKTVGKFQTTIVIRTFSKFLIRAPDSLYNERGMAFQTGGQQAYWAANIKDKSLFLREREYCLGNTEFRDKGPERERENKIIAVRHFFQIY